MKKQNVCLTMVVCVSLMLLSSCSSDDNPTSPSLSSNVAGTWSFVGKITSNTCRLMQNNPDYVVGKEGTDVYQINQNGINLTVIGEMYNFTGTVIGNNMRLAISNPIVQTTSWGCTYSIGGGIDIARTSENSGNGSENLTWIGISGDCLLLEPLPCSIVWTGQWTRTDATKQKDTEVSSVSLIHSMQQLVDLQ